MMKRTVFFKSFSFFIFFLLLVPVFSQNIFAQQKTDGLPENQSYTLQEMLVTATKRVQSAQDVPFSLDVKSEEDINRLNISDFEELSRNVAGLSVQNLGPGQSVVSIRGVSSGQIVRDQPGIKEQVGVYLDETPISLSLFTPEIDLFDLNRVETLRGPQGTLFGSGSIGGTVRYITHQPALRTNESKAEVDFNIVDGGSLGGHVKTAVNIPFGDTVAARLVTYGTRYPGFIDALMEGGRKKEDVNDGHRLGGRFSLLWQPTENLSITPRVVFQEIDLGGFNRKEVFNIFANPYTTTRPVIRLGKNEQFLRLDEGFEDDMLLLDTVVNWSLGDLLDVTYAVAYINRDVLVSRDSSALATSVTVDLEFPAEAAMIPSNLRDTTDLEQWTHELRIHSDEDSDAPFHWLAGLFYSDSQRNYSQRLPMPGYDAYVDAKYGAGTTEGVSNGFPDRDSPYISDLTYDLQQIALFGEASYGLFERLDLTAGLRWYTWDEDKTFKSGGFFSNSAAQDQKVSQDSNGFSPRFMISYDFTDQITMNAQASRGFRLGGVNDPLNKTLCGDGYDTYRVYQNFEDETLWNYEVGFKSSFDVVSLNASVFYTDISNLGVNVDAGQCSSRVTISVPEAHTVGTEVEFSARPSSSLLLSVAGSYVSAEFDSTIKTSSGDPIAGIEKGNRIPSVPDWQLSSAATYSFPGFFKAAQSYLSASWQYVGTQFTQSGDQVDGAGSFAHGFTGFGGMTGSEVTNLDLELDSYNLFNLSAGLVYNNAEITLYVNNITDEEVELSFDRERGGRARLAYRVAQPRTFGMVTRMYF